MTGEQILISVRELSDSANRGTAAQNMATRNRQSSSQIDLVSRFLASCARHSSRTAIQNRERCISYHQLQKYVCQFAGHLSENTEFQTGDHVGLILGNSVEYIAAFYGTLMAGGVVVPLPASESATEIETLCDIADVKFVAGYQAFCQHGQAACSTIIELGSQADSSIDRTEQSPDQLAVLMLTSGSSGDRKAVMLSQRNLIANCDSICDFLPITQKDRTLAIAPFNHALGNSVLQTHLLSGACLVLGCDHRFPASIIEWLSEHACTSLVAVPEIFAGLASETWGDRLAQQLNYLAVAGGAMPPAQAQRIQAQIHPAPLYLMYGQTEATARLAYLPPDQLTTSSAEAIGIPIPGVKLEIRDSNGNRVEPGCCGMLSATGENIMLGYYGDAELTAKTLHDGWLRTGDVAMVRADGLIQLQGRSSNRIKIQGHRLHPADVERRVMDAIDGVQVVVTDFEFYQKIRLAIFAVVENGAAIDTQQIRSICKKILPTHMLPQRYRILEQWPTNSSGKIDRVALQRSISSATVAVTEADTSITQTCGEQI